MIVFPATIEVPKTNRPTNSIARLTVTGISFTMDYSFQSLFLPLVSLEVDTE